MIKWNRKICIQYATEMRSALEEANKANVATTPVDRLRIAGDKMRERLLTSPREDIIEAQ